MSKQAVAILVHQNISQINSLIAVLKNDFDLYIHIDKKSIIDTRDVHCRNVWKEIEVRWGGFGMVRATMLLYKKILATGIPYTHVVLLSADTLPVKSTRFISNFLSAHQGISFLENIAATGQTLERPRLFWFDSDIRKNPTGFKKYLNLPRLLRAAQRILKIYRNTKGFERTGSQWTILALPHVEHLVENCNIAAYKMIAVPDESFVQDHFYNYNIPHNDNIIFANWTNPRGNSPDFIDERRYRELLNTKYLFARKFKAGTNYRPAPELVRDSASSK